MGELSGTAAGYYLSTFESLSFESDTVDFERKLFQALVNEGKHIRILNADKYQFRYSEKALRDEAAAEIAQVLNVDDPDSKESKKRKTLNDDERSQQSRDRNKEHAKNTRLRKKAYLAKLKDLVDRMTEQKIAEDTEHISMGKRVHDTQSIRMNAVRLFLLFRTACVVDRNKWADILDENFEFLLPVTPYRSFSRGDINNSTRVVTGIDSLVADTNSMALLAESIGLNTEVWKYAIKRGECYRGVYTVRKEDMLASGDVIMCRYVLSMTGTETFQRQDSMSCIQHGMLKCQFNSNHKIVHAEVVFDVHGFMQQLQQVSMMHPSQCIIPNTLDQALQPCPQREARSIICVRPNDGHTTLFVNDTWTSLTGLSQFASEGRPLMEMLPVHPAFHHQIKMLCRYCEAGIAGSRIMVLLHPGQTQQQPQGRMIGDDINTTTRSHSVVYVRMFPLSSTSSKTTSHMLVVLLPLTVEDGELDVIIAKHGDVIGPTASSIHPSCTEALKNAHYCATEYIRQLAIFNVHYPNAGSSSSLGVVNVLAAANDHHMKIEQGAATISSGDGSMAIPTPTTGMAPVPLMSMFQAPSAAAFHPNPPYVNAYRGHTATHYATLPPAFYADPSRQQYQQQPMALPAVGGAYINNQPGLRPPQMFHQPPQQPPMGYHQMPLNLSTSSDHGSNAFPASVQMMPMSAPMPLNAPMSMSMGLGNLGPPSFSPVANYGELNQQIMAQPYSLHSATTSQYAPVAVNASNVGPKMLPPTGYSHGQRDPGAQPHDASDN